ncbi:Heat shock protein Hsp90 [Solidesulfovibrio carbinoliphilus subsp. oakridgensis]|uniref:Chaperone protein HtpG n=1 Tax=Solidesulfovibrio carbinoliphilus subsp. oakridgensis TaxID=694327 RepID=G7Q9Y9_9BACT|nr:molecular chaperone HtpG [Solidesulfovibrio carbinoliphilus]EHJ47819.1 Heat shock protein Hsp90 [Solidesulfovibrio carbinoliphilus subsp. oakridgensis]
MTATPKGETHEFRAEIRKLLDIITHSIYTNREIFLRELVSNASDALDKLRFETSRGTAVADPDTPLEIRITTDKDGGRLTVADTGCGMSREELVDHLGTIAKSGTEAFMKSVADNAENKDAASNLIGRFGVGFYSVFMVADKVTVTSRSLHADAAPARWISDGSGNFTIEDVEGEVPRGTSIDITLKADTKEYADPERLKAVLRTHSNFISFPILVDGEKTNTIPALWRESKFSVTPEQYKEFYQFLTYDTDEPLATIHVSVDAPVQFTALLFIPKKGLGPMAFREALHHGLDLYVRRVLISKETKELIPEYLGFVRGVVDTEDLPLNLSRETLQENIVLRKIQSVLVKQVLDKLKNLAKENPDAYAEFFKEHGQALKLGYGDYANREAFADLMRFDSSAIDPDAGFTSLAAYVERAKEGQKSIYYLSGPSRAALDLNPHLEIFRSKGLEVLYLHEPVDEFIMDTIGTYKELQLKSAELADASELDAFEGTAPKPEAPELSKDDEAAFDDFLKKTKELLGDRVTEVRLSTRLTQSPSCLVSPDDHMTSSMQKIMRLVSKDTSIPKKALELNRDHPLIRNLLSIYRRDAADPFLGRAVEQLYDSALLLDGYLADPHQMVARINELLSDASALHVK